MAVRIALVGDTELRAETLADALADDERLSIISARAESSFGNPTDENPDVVVAIACEAHFECPTVVLTDGSDARRGDAHAWLPLNSSIAEIAAAIYAAACDLTVFTADQLRHSRKRTSETERSDDEVPVERLTPRELQVLRMLSDGLGNKEIAGQLGLSDHTAKYHVAQILAKLGAASRTEAVSIGIRRGLVPL